MPGKVEGLAVAVRRWSEAVEEAEDGAGAEEYQEVRRCLEGLVPMAKSMRRLRELLLKEGGSVVGADDWALFANVVQREVPAWATFVGEVVESGAGAKQEVSGAGAKQEVQVEEKHVTKPDKGVDVRNFGLPPVSLPKYSGEGQVCRLVGAEAYDAAGAGSSGEELAYYSSAIVVEW